MSVEYGWLGPWIEALLDLAVENRNKRGKQKEVFFYLDWWNELTNACIDWSTPCPWLKNLKEFPVWTVPIDDIIREQLKVKNG